MQSNSFHRLNLSLFAQIDMNNDEYEIIDIRYEASQNTKNTDSVIFCPPYYSWKNDLEISLDRYYNSYWDYNLKNLSPSFIFRKFAKRNVLLCSNSAKQLISISRWARKNNIPHNFINQEGVFNLLEKNTPSPAPIIEKPKKKEKPQKLKMPVAEQTSLF